MHFVCSTLHTVLQNTIFSLLSIKLNTDHVDLSSYTVCVTSCLGTCGAGCFPGGWDSIFLTSKTLLSHVQILYKLSVQYCVYKACTGQQTAQKHLFNMTLTVPLITEQ